MANLEARFIDLLSTPGGNGTTPATTGVNRAYATASEWEAEEEKNLETGDFYHHVKAEGGESLEQLVISGWTTNDTDNYIIFEVAANSRSDGTFGSGFRLVTTAGAAQVFEMNQDGTIVIGLECTGTGNNVDAIRYNATGGMFLFCLMQGNSSNGAGYSSSSNDGGFVFGSIVKDTGDGLFAGNADVAKWYNNTVIDCGTGIERAGTSGTPPNIANNAVFGSSITDYVVTIGLTAASTNNASEDLTAVGSNPLTGLVDGDFSNIAGGDFSIPDNSSALYNAGADVASAVSAFDRTDFTVPLEDIIGTPRPQDSTWDIGAFELPVSSGTTVTPDPVSNLQALSNVTLTQHNVFSVDNIETAQTISSPSFTQANILSVDNIETAQTLSSVTLSIAGALVVQGLTSSQTIQATSFIQHNLLNVDDLESAQVISESVIDTGLNLIVQDITNVQSISEPGLTQHHILLVDPITNTQFIGVVNIGGDGQDIGTVTAAFKESGISVNYGIAQFTVKFKE